jgi:hypothetical protein
MADKSPPIRKKPVSQKRVALVLASLVGMMTFSAAILLLMEGGALGIAVPGWAVSAPDIAAMVEPSKPLRTGAWNYIIIYESGDLAASADSLSEGHVTGGVFPTTVRPKANFHFVIDSAQSGTGTMDGELQVGTSWQNQETGAPYVGWPDRVDPRSHSFPLYNDAVGICLAGDLNREPPGVAQNQTLLLLVRELQQRLNIRKECVMFQWDSTLEGRQATPKQQAYARTFRAALQ